jgi:CelD/BcsL family acetyltransferase involved in cellulose biosynthesis
MASIAWPIAGRMPVTFRPLPIEAFMAINAAAPLPHPLTKGDLRHEVRHIESVDALMALRQTWRGLAAVAEECPACMTFEYGELAASQVLAKSGTIGVAMVFRNHELLALWPVSIVRKGLLRIARALTCGSGEEYGGPLVKAGANSAANCNVYAAAVAAIMQIDADVLEIPWVREGSALQAALESAPQSWVHALLPAQWRSLPGYSISLREFAQWDDFMRTLPKSLRISLRYRRKRLEARGRVEFGWCKSPSDAASVLTWLFDNKRRWAERRGLRAPYLMDHQVRDFFIALAHRIDLATNPLVAFVKLDGVPVAASVNLVGSRSMEIFIDTYDEAFSPCSVGNLLNEFQIWWSHASGRDFDFRPPYSEHKASWANCRTQHETRLIILRLWGRLAEFSLLTAEGLRVKRKLVQAVGLVGKQSARDMPAASPP